MRGTPCSIRIVRLLRGEARKAAPFPHSQRPADARRPTIEIEGSEAHAERPTTATLARTTLLARAPLQLPDADTPTIASQTRGPVADSANEAMPAAQKLARQPGIRWTASRQLVPCNLRPTIRKVAPVAPEIRWVDGETKRVVPGIRLPIRQNVSGIRRIVPKSLSALLPRGPREGRDRSPRQW
jgi:hypothetical protein